MRMANATGLLPRYIVVRQFDGNKDKPAYYKDDGSGSVLLGGDEGVFSAYAKVEVEPATDPASNYVHLRFCFNNRYWQKKEGDQEKWIVAVSNERDEGTSKPSCTLFEPVSNGEKLYLVHVQSGGHVKLDTSSEVMAAMVGDPADDATTFNNLEFLDWELLVRLPPHVAFKNAAGYLHHFVHDSSNVMQFGSADPSSVSCGYRVDLMPDGHVKIFSDYFQQYWWNFNGYLIFANDAGMAEVNHLFWPVKIDDNTIALRSALDQNFCRGVEDSWGSNLLVATEPTITQETRLQVEELVLGRKIYYVQYMMEEARMFDEAPYLAGTAMLINDGDTESSESVTITYEDSKSYTFSRGMSITAGVSTEIECGVPFIAEGKVEISFSITGNFQWDTTTTTTTSIAATGTVVVPARSWVIVDYVGTKGTCEIPYAYTQLDKNSRDGTSVRSNHVDGTYKGVSCYNFNFHIRKQSLI